MDRKPHQILYTVRGSCSPGTEFKIKKVINQSDEFGILKV